jgi:hypothetical protein
MFEGNAMYYAYLIMYWLEARFVFLILALIVELIVIIALWLRQRRL